MPTRSPPSEAVCRKNGARARFVGLVVIGHAPNIITGLSVSLQAAVLPVIVISASMWIAYSVGGGLYGMALVAVAMLSVVMLSMVSIVVAVNSYDPFTDNADGIAKMAKPPHEVRSINDALDAVIGQADIGKPLTDGFVTMANAMLVAIGLVYLLLVPLVTFFALPLVVIGAFVVLAVTGYALDLSALIGLLMLSDIVVTNAIVLLDLV
jgi:Na+/H+-translocating membrane pyrophosphatase